jgi:hypothetical protein
MSELITISMKLTCRNNRISLLMKRFSSKVLTPITICMEQHMRNIRAHQNLIATIVFQRSLKSHPRKSSNSYQWVRSLRTPHPKRTWTQRHRKAEGRRAKGGWTLTYRTLTLKKHWKHSKSKSSGAHHSLSLGVKASKLIHKRDRQYRLRNNKSKPKIHKCSRLYLNRKLTDTYRMTTALRGQW